MLNHKIAHPKDLLLFYIDRIYQNAMTTTSGGNLSMLDPDGNIWITPSRKDKGRLVRDDMVCVDPQGKSEHPLPPSSEFPFHRAIYKRRPDIKAVIHAHPPALVSFSMVGRCPELQVTAKTKRIIKDVAFAPYALPGSEDLGEAIAIEFEKGTNAVVLENHGVVVGGTDIHEAFKIFETLDFAARVQIQSARIGETHLLEGELSRYDRPAANITERLKHSPSMEELELRHQIVDFNRRAYKQRLFSSTEGIISCRIKDEAVVISPKFSDRLTMDESDLVWVNDDKSEEGHMPSDSTPLHQAIYKENPEVKAIIVAVPPNAMGFCAAHREIKTEVIPEAWILLQNPPLIELDDLYEDHQAIAKTIADGNPVLLCKNDSVICTGKNLLEAFDRLEVLEYSAKSLVNSFPLGQLSPINQSQIDDLRKAFLA